MEISHKTYWEVEDHNYQTGKSIRLSSVDVYRNVASIGRDRKEWRYTRQMAEIYGHRPSVRPVATMSSSGDGDHARSPSPLEIYDTEGTDLTEDCTEDCAPTLSKKARRSAQSGRETTKKCFMKMMMSCREERERQHQEKMKMLEKMHEDKMALVSRLLDAIKDSNTRTS